MSYCQVIKPNLRVYAFIAQPDINIAILGDGNPVRKLDSTGSFPCRYNEVSEPASAGGVGFEMSFTLRESDG